MITNEVIKLIIILFSKLLRTIVGNKNYKIHILIKIEKNI